ncbi:MAG: hypothetical protein NTY03_05150, partial [Candidatus Bathyarchaeota archaeon]|nr:hypothetical protein [Candidatus Bathyarchaeota archaeon]
LLYWMTWIVVITFVAMLTTSLLTFVGLIVLIALVVLQESELMREGIYNQYQVTLLTAGEVIRESADLLATQKEKIALLEAELAKV